MTNAWTKVAVLAGLMAVMLFGGVGCTSKPRLGNYTITLEVENQFASTFANVPLQVDLVGLTEEQKVQWAASGTPAEYFAAGGARRAQTSECRRTYNFDKSNTGMTTLKRNDPIWATWNKGQVRHLAVMSYSLAMKPSASEDSRKLIIPLTTDCFKDGETIKLVAGASGVICVTPQIPKN
ncbi:MAG: hypothetical protein ACOYN0_13355 [Phycisphaerales bacterium]